MRRTVFALIAALAAFAPARAAEPAPIADVVPPALLDEALAARERFAGRVANARRLAIIDYRRPSSERRMYLVDLADQSVEALLVAHGRGSDPDHDGVADRFSNAPDSKMSSLGAYVTGGVYQGRHGLSLRLVGLEATNDNAERRAIVIHGADYVAPDRAVLGRSWGCPAVETSEVAHIINAIRGGAFVYVVG